MAFCAGVKQATRVDIVNESTQPEISPLVNGDGNRDPASLQGWRHPWFPHA